MIDVIELFAGVGGFRLGLEGYKKPSDNFYSSLTGYSELIEHPKSFNTVLSNQFEPGTKNQIASSIYVKRFGDQGHYNININQLHVEDIIKCQIKFGDKSNPLMMVGGFPCQDYSVAALAQNSKGLKGSKGSLWWEINRLLKELKEDYKAPEYLLFENVDRLLKSPINSRGSDFATMLFCLGKLGYTVEYQIINSADLGFVQKRSRLFILAYLGEPRGLLHNALDLNIVMHGDLIEIPDYKFTKANITRLQFKFDGLKQSPFLNGGIFYDGIAHPYNAQLAKPNERLLFEDIRIDESLEDLSAILVANESIDAWRVAKGSKKFIRYKPDGTPYNWSEGEMDLYQKNDKPLRTMVTSEGGTSPSRTRHLIPLKNKLNQHEYRILHPLEMERANMFPDNFTAIYGITPKKVGFLMGNSLVIGIVEKIRNSILEYELNK